MISDEIYAIGIDVGGTKIAGGIVALTSGAVLTRQIVPTRPEHGGEAVLAETRSLADMLLREARASRLRVLGVGVGICELVNLQGIVTSGFTVRWHGIDVQSALSDLAPTVVEADVRAHALAEARFGAGQPYRIFVYISVGTGISACLVLDGRPFAGARGNALVLASGPTTIVREDGSRERQILEEFASGSAIARRFGTARAEDVFAAAATGDKAARRILSTAGEALGSSIGWVANVLDPEALVIGGGLGLAGGIFWDQVVATARDHIWSDATRRLPMLHAALGADAGVIGAAEACRRMTIHT
jgi:glucokinase